MDNYASVIYQMEAFGVQFLPRDLPLTIPTPKRKTCGKQGKWWYWLQLWRPDSAPHTEYITGKFGTYKHGGSEQKVEMDFKPLTDAEKARFRAEREAQEQAARAAKAEAAAIAALGAAELWGRASRTGHSPYLERKGVQGESCRYLADGTVVVPLLRYDAPQCDRLRALQRIQPDGFKLFTKGFAKTGCAVRLGVVDADTSVILVCEGYATGLSIRMATDRQVPVYVALDAYNLVFVVEILRKVHPDAHLLICADDDWKSEDHDGKNPGVTKAKLAARTTAHCDLVWPVFKPSTRQEKDTDFNDLHLREGLDVVARQLQAVLAMLKRVGWKVRRGR
ncbi:toprim domain-containing protein [Caenimonas terrae]|uniref:Toprim domain-containing protein n=1 Tax=Caenimonas terrae TaxID=696074 RepID=A0ABW0NF05_9BURK